MISDFGFQISDYGREASAFNLQFEICNLQWLGRRFLTVFLTEIRFTYSGVLLHLLG